MKVLQHANAALVVTNIIFLSNAAAADAALPRNSTYLRTASASIVESPSINSTKTKSHQQQQEQQRVIAALRDFQELRTGTSKKLAFEAYEQARSGCHWQEQEDDREAFDYMYWKSDADLKADYWGDLTSWTMAGGAHIPGWITKILKKLFRPPPHGKPLQSSFCQVPTADGKQEWRIRRLGPFVSTGGFDWHRIQLLDPFEFQNQEAGDNVMVTARFLGPVSSEGKLMGNPPIHIHHANMNVEHKQTNFSRIGQWHGDSQCLERDGGTSCYLRALPSGYGFPVSRSVPIQVDADLNDVRPQGSEKMEFYLETSIRIRESSTQSKEKEDGETKMTSVGQIILGTPGRGELWKSTDFAGTYFVPTNEPSALWCTARMPVSGSFVSGHEYTHQGLFQEAFIFSGVSPNDLGLNDGGPFTQKHPWDPWVPDINEWENQTIAMEALRNHVLSKFEDAQSNACGDDKNNCTNLPRLVFHLNQTSIDDAGVARQMPWPNNSWTFEKDEEYTTVIFHKAMSHHDGGDDKPPQWIQQHLAMHGTYLPDYDHPAEYHYILPALQSDKAWLDRPNDWELFARQFTTKTRIIVSIIGIGFVLATVFTVLKQKGFALPLSNWMKFVFRGGYKYSPLKVVD